MRTTLTLDDDIYALARSMAESSGRSLGAVLSELARRGLRPEPIRKRTGGLPTFEVSASAEAIPSDRAAALLADEGTD